MDVGPVTINTSGTKVDRNLEIKIDCSLALNGNYRIAVRRQVLVKDANGKVVHAGVLGGAKAYTIEKKLSEIAAETVTITGNKTLTGAEIAEAIEKMTDKFVQP